MPRYEYATTKLHVMTCGKGGCGIVYAVPDDFDEARRRDGKTFYCPNGCSRVYRVSEEDRLRERLNAAQARATAERDQREAAERSLSATRGHLTRSKKRAAAGVCQCCNRTFQNLASHMQTKHPGFVADARTETPADAGGSTRRLPASGGVMDTPMRELIDRALLAALVDAGGEIVDRKGHATGRLYDAVTAQLDTTRSYASIRLGALDRGEGLVGREVRGPYVYRVWLTEAGREHAAQAGGS